MNLRRTPHLLLRCLRTWMAAGAATLAGLLAAEDWPHYLGPRHDGVSIETNRVDRWAGAAPAVSWRAQVGLGFSAVSIAQGRLLTAGHRAGRDIVWCLDAATGKPVWQRDYPAELGDKFYDGGTGATPTVEGDRVYVLSRWGDVLCLGAADGKVHWQRQLAKQEDARVPGWGWNGSPLVLGRLLLLNVGAAGWALDKATGKTVWKSADGEAGYSTPQPITWHGQPRVVFSSENAYTAVNPQTGAAVWSIRWLTRYGVNAARALVRGDEVFVSSGYSKGAALFRVGEGGAEEVWRQRQFRNQFSSALLLDGHLYGVDGDNDARAKLKCVDWKTGEVQWEAELGFGSLTAAGDRLIVLTAAGELVMAAAAPKSFQPVARAKVLEGRCWTMPVLSQGRLYCRNAAGELVCLDLRRGQ